MSLLLLNDLYLGRLLAENVVLFWAADAAQFVVVPLIAFWAVARFAAVDPEMYGLGFSGLKRPTELCLDIALATLLFWLAYDIPRFIAYRYLWQHAGTFLYGAALPASPMLHHVVAVYLAITAAVVEEITFRGLPWLYFTQLVGHRRARLPYVLISSLLFGAIHSEQGPHAVIATFCLGLAASAFYSRLQSLWPFVAAHLIIGLINLS